ncbi:MAG: AMP-binding protein [Syntrophales bacterium]
MSFDSDEYNTGFQGTIPQLLASHAESFIGEQAAIREKAYGIWDVYSWKDYLGYVRKIGLGLISIGLKRGEVVGLITDNHSEWLFSEIGTQAVGGITLNLFTSAVSTELATALNRVSAAFVFAENQEQVDKLIESRGQLDHVKNVIYIDPTGMRLYIDNPWIISFSDLLDKGEKLDGERSELFHDELKKGRGDETALMIQTSGTTGVPKMAMLSHQNIITIGRMWTTAINIKPGENWLSMSPPAWIVDQMWAFGVALYSGMTMNFPEMPETVVEDFREIGPSRIITASRFWEDMASKIRVKMGDAGFIKRYIFNQAERVGLLMETCRMQKKNPSLLLTVLHKLSSVIIYRRLLDRMGCANFLGAYTGGHPISPDVIIFFRSFGLNLKQCYGLTESGGIFQIQPDDEVKPETVGKPLPGVEIKIDESQEVLIRSGSTFQGYYQNQQATEAAYSDGWLRTGDAGYLDQDGHLLIIGRKEEVIRNKSGEAFSPDFIETRLKFSPFIKEAVIFGEGRPFLTALINIDLGNTGSWAEKRMIPYTTYTDLSQQPPVEELILAEVRTVNQQLPEVMKINKFILLYKLLDADDEELTRTGKVRRHFVSESYSLLIEGMYTGKGEIPIKGKVRYRDGQVGEIDTVVRVITAL